MMLVVCWMRRNFRLLSTVELQKWCWNANNTVCYWCVELHDAWRETEMWNTVENFICHFFVVAREGEKWVILWVFFRSIKIKLQTIIFMFRMDILLICYCRRFYRNCFYLPFSKMFKIIESLWFNVSEKQAIESIIQCKIADRYKKWVM